MKHIKKFNEEVNELEAGMVPVTPGRYGRQFKATITFELNGYLSEDDDRDGISLKEAKNLILTQLEELSGSNDGGELLANISENQIKINTVY
jgi:hypothetical protein